MAKLTLNHPEAVKIISSFTGDNSISIDEKKLNVEFSGNTFSLKSLNIQGTLKTGKMTFEVKAESLKDEIRVSLL